MGLAVALICAAALVWWLSMRRQNPVVRADFNSRSMTPDALEAEVRRALPLGSSVAVVDGFLTAHRLEHSFDSSTNVAYAIVRHLKGSNFVTAKSLAFTFHFDRGSKLKSIDAKVKYTGP